MARIVAVACAVLAGLGAALFLTLGPSVVVNGHVRQCAGVIVAAESNAGGPDNPGVSPCDGARAQWTWDAAGLGLICVVAGVAAAFSRREEETDSATPARAGSAGLHPAG